MEKKTRILSLLVAVCMITALCAGCSNSGTAAGTTAAATTAAGTTAAGTTAGAEDPLDKLEPVSFTLATTNAEAEMSDQGTRMFIELVEERSKGKIKFDYVPNAQLGSQQELAESMNLGTLTFGKLDPTTMNGYIPEFNMLIQPFLIQNYDHMAKAVQLDVIKKLEGRLATEFNITVLSWMWCGFRAMCSKTPIRNVADCKGILLRSPQAQIYMDTFNLLGMSPTPIAFSELYTAVQSGVVDGAEPAASVIYNNELYKLAPYVCRSNHMFSMNILCANTETWNSLPELYRQIMTECAAEAQVWQWKAMEDEEDGYFEKMAANGATITTWDNVQELVDLFTPYWQQSVDKIGGVAGQMLKDIQALA